MKSSVWAAVVAMIVGSAIASGQQPVNLQPKTPTQTIQSMIDGVERDLTGVAEEMPADKYEFAPTQGEFRGVRNFARQIKHAASVHYLVAADRKSVV